MQKQYAAIGKQVNIVLKSDGTSPTLTITANAENVTANQATYVTFTVTDNSQPVSGVHVDVTGAATGSGTTNTYRRVTILINAAMGTITATASKTGFNAGTTTLPALQPPTLTITANPDNVTVNTPTYVTFTVTNTNQPVSGANVYVTGAGTGSGTTNTNGQVTILINAAFGTITATASKSGYISGTTSLIATSTTPTITPSVTPTVTPTGTIVSIANITITPNRSTTRSIMIENANSLSAANIVLTYDPTVVNVQSALSGDLGGVISNIDNTTGRTSMVAFSTTPQNGNVVFANIVLNAVGQLNTTSLLALSVQSLADLNGNGIPYTIRNGEVKISNVVKGDVNGDGQVTIVDALFVGQYTVGSRTLTSTQLAAADVNGDGQVTVVDALFIAQYTVGLRQL